MPTYVRPSFHSFKLYANMPVARDARDLQRIHGCHPPLDPITPADLTSVNVTTGSRKGRQGYGFIEGNGQSDLFFLPSSLPKDLRGAASMVSVGE